MLRALVSQIEGQLGGTPTALVQLHTRYHNSSQPEKAPLGCLHQLVRVFRDVYIILDALDESPSEKNRKTVLEAVEDIRSWLESGLHLIATSRWEVGIRDGLEPKPKETIPMRNDGIDKDIASFISGSLRGNRLLRKFQVGVLLRPDRAGSQREIRGPVSSVVLFEVDSPHRLIQLLRFRWVDYPLNALAGCAVSEDLLEQLLQTLPQTLDETCREMSQNISPMMKLSPTDAGRDLLRCETSDCARAH